MAYDPRRSAERIVLDTNVLASALAFGGVPESILELGRGGLVRIFASSFILGELAQVLAAKKFGWTASEIAEVIKSLREFVSLVEPEERLRIIAAEPDDNRILECGAAAQAQVIVTGNMKHIRPLGAFEGIHILTPREFLDRYFPGT
jgi:putative PIN family toxin of toxin-antitoxin system